MLVWCSSFQTSAPSCQTCHPQKYATLHKSLLNPWVISFLGIIRIPPSAALPKIKEKTFGRSFNPSGNEPELLGQKKQQYLKNPLSQSFIAPTSVSEEGFCHLSRSEREVSILCELPSAKDILSLFAIQTMLTMATGMEIL